jgi:hypothetical protein
VARSVWAVAAASLSNVRKKAVQGGSISAARPLLDGPAQKRKRKRKEKEFWIRLPRVNGLNMAWATQKK